MAIASELVLRGAHVVGDDRLAGPNFAGASRCVDVVNSFSMTLKGADACIIQAAWSEFTRLGAKHFSRMASPVVIDGRGTWPKGNVPKGIRYRRIGQG